MCGFVGLYLNDNYNIEVRKLVSILNNMTDTLSHRGPDHKDIYVNEAMNLLRDLSSIQSDEILSQINLD